MKRTVSAFLLLSVLSMCASCGEGGASSETESRTDDTLPEATETAAYLDTLPVKDFGGAAFRVIGQSTRDRQNFFIEELEGETINDALHARDRAVEERLNVKLVYEALSDRKEVANRIIRSVNADEDAYDLALTAMSAGINDMVNANVLYDLNAIPHLTLTSEYWDKSIHGNMQFYDKQYFTSGPLSMQFYQTPIVAAFNKRLAEDNGLSDIYQTVLDGRWTVDYLNSLTKEISTDLDGDGKMTFEDFYVFTWDKTLGNALYTASGYQPVKIENGAYRVVLDDPISVDIIEKCAKIFGDPDVMYQNLNSDGSSLRLFQAGRAIFLDADLNSVMSFRDMEDDFGIIPVPKLDEKQETYLSACNTWLPNGIAVPRTCADPEKTGLIMETMAVLSREIIMPAAYEITLQGKVARDDVSVKMLDIIFENSSFDFITVFDFGGSSALLRESVLGIRENFMSSYASIRSSVEAEINRVMENSK